MNRGRPYHTPDRPRRLRAATCDGCGKKLTPTTAHGWMSQHVGEHAIEVCPECAQNGTLRKLQAASPKVIA